MKKKLLKIAVVLVALALIATIVGPGLILNAVRQPEPDTGYAYSQSFRTTYEQTRIGLEELIESLRAEGIAVEAESYAVDAADDLYIDSFYLPSSGEKTNLIVLTTGVHGMEGFMQKKTIYLNYNYED